MYDFDSGNLKKMNLFNGVEINAYTCTVYALWKIKSNRKVDQKHHYLLAVLDSIHA